MTTLAVLEESEIYIGTTWGCIVVAEGSTMRPITIFRPFNEEVKAILPIASKNNEESTSQKSPPTLVSIGKGYRSLISRYTTLPLSSAGQEVYDYSSMYVLLWRTNDWLNV